MGVLGICGAFAGGVAAVVTWPATPIGAIAFALVGLAWLLRTLWIRLEIAENGLVVRNVFHTQRVEWVEVERIGWTPLAFSAATGSVPALAIKPRKGRLIRATATAGFGRSQSERLAQTIADIASRTGIEVDVTADDLRMWPPFRGRKSPPL
jgi:uncharacterized membrane protein YfcA